MDAIQDFTCKKSLYNRTQGFAKRDDTLTRMPLKKLIGRQTILMPSKLRSNDHSVTTQADPMPSSFSKKPRRRLEDSLLHGESIVDGSHISTTEKMSNSMMRKLLNDFKFGGSTHHNLVV